MATTIDWGGPVEYAGRSHTVVIADSLGTQARCVTCGWQGPERTNDEHDFMLVLDDVTWHLHEEGLACPPPDYLSCRVCAEAGR